MKNVRKHLRANAVGYIALSLALGTSTAWAATELGRNTVRSRHIVNQQVKSIDLENGTIKAKDVEANALGGAQIAESTLGVVPDADRVDGIDAGSFRNSAEVDAGGDSAWIELFSVGPLKVDLACADVFNSSVLSLASTSTRAGATIRTIVASDDLDPRVQSTGIDSMNANERYLLTVAASDGARAVKRVNLTYFAPGARPGDRFVSADLLLFVERGTGDDCRAMGTYLTRSF